MKYYVVSDVHGYYTQLMTALEEKGFFKDEGEHKLIVCGDLFDRGMEAKELQEFILYLMETDEVILIRGNHEDLFMQLIYEDGGHPYFPHDVNGTYNTGLQLIEGDDTMSITEPKRYVEKARLTPYVRKIIPATRNYFETDNYVFVHGWIPCYLGGYYYGWRDADKEMWEKARWYNGMQMWHNGVVEPGKTIVCGHYSAAYGHTTYEYDEFRTETDYSPFIADGIIALDACTKLSNMVNCVIIED